MKFNEQLNIPNNSVNNSEYKNFKLEDFREANKNSVSNILNINEDKHYLSEMELAKIFGLSQEQKNKLAEDHIKQPFDSIGLLAS